MVWFSRLFSVPVQYELTKKTKGSTGVGLPQVWWGWRTPGTLSQHLGPTASCPGCEDPKRRSCHPGYWWSQETCKQNTQTSTRAINNSLSCSVRTSRQVWITELQPCSPLTSSSGRGGSLVSESPSTAASSTAAHLCHDKPHPVSSFGTLMKDRSTAQVY